MKRQSKRTKRLIEADKANVWHPFTQMSEWADSTPIVIERGEGNYLIDTDGNRYLDAASSLWVTVHGHRVREIDSAVKAQLDKIAHTTLLGLASVPSIELAERLVEITPKNLTRLFYSDNGSTAVEVALKLSYQYWYQSGAKEKKRFVSFTGAYHGDTFGSMSVGEVGAFVGKFRPLLFKSLYAPYAYCYRCPVKLSYPGCKIACLDKLENLLKKSHKEVAAVVIEPLVQGAAGMITAPKGFLKGVARLAKKYDVHLIADEVAVGFGRTGNMIACDEEKVRPDFLCLAKGITGGYLPLAATLTTEKIYKKFLGPYEELNAFFHGHTYTGNPLGCAAAIANLDLFKKRKTIEKVKKSATLMAKLLEPLKKCGHVGDIRQHGLMAGIELVKNKKTKTRFAMVERVGYKISMETRKVGVITRPIGDTMIIMPPFSIKAGELRKIVTSVHNAIVKVTG